MLLVASDCAATARSWEAERDVELAKFLSKERRTIECSTSWRREDHLRAPSIDHVELWVPKAAPGGRWKRKTTIIESDGQMVQVGREVKGHKATLKTNQYGTSLAFNPNRALDPTGWGLHPYALGAETIRGAAEWLADEFDSDLGLVGIRVLDLARDIEGVRHPPWYIESMRNLPRWNRYTFQYWASRDGVGRSAYAKSSTSHVKIYDKGAQVPKKHKVAATGVLRVETRLSAKGGEGWLAGSGPNNETKHPPLDSVDGIDRIYKGMPAPDGGPAFDPSRAFDQYLRWFGAELVLLAVHSLRRYLRLRGLPSCDIERFVDLARRREERRPGETEFLMEMVAAHRCWISGTTDDGPERLTAGGILVVTGERPELGWTSRVLRDRHLELVAASV